MFRPFLGNGGIGRGHFFATSSAESALRSRNRFKHVRLVVPELETSRKW